MKLITLLILLSGFVSNAVASDSTATKIERYSYVFIDGMMGDFSNSLYSSIETYIQNVTRNGTDVTIIRPSSFATLAENAEALNMKLKRLGGPRPYILIAHSRGAAELFIALLKYPELFYNLNIARVILVQGAFSGSPVAEMTQEYLNKFCHSNSPKWMDEPCAFAGVFRESLRGLTPIEARKARMELQKNISPSDHQLFKERVFFVRSKTTLKKARFALKPSALFLNHYYYAFDNDGLLITIQQKVPGFGTDLGVYDADHMDLLSRSKSNPGAAITFFNSLVNRFQEPIPGTHTRRFSQ
jgi:pimeloyl-ACP methyl ester carboxylesterase